MWGPGCALSPFLGKPQCRASLTKQPWGAGGGGAEGPDPSHSGQTCTFLPGSHAAARLMKRLFLCRAQGWGWEGAGSRRWGWCDVAVNQTAFKRAGEEGSTRVGRFWLWDVYKFAGGYLRIFIPSPIHSCPWNEYQIISIQGSSLLLQQPALIPFSPQGPTCHTCWCIYQRMNTHT